MEIKRFHDFQTVFIRVRLIYYGWVGYGRLAGGYSAAKTQVKRVRPFVHY